VQLQKLQQQAQRVAAHPWVEKLARFGYAAKGTVYFVVGLLTAQAAIGSGGETTSTSGALEELVAQPFGKVLLGLIAMEKRIADLPIVKWWQRDSCQMGMLPMMALACISSTGHWQSL
jgi:hypothetical protein